MNTGTLAAPMIRLRSGRGRGWPDAAPGGDRRCAENRAVVLAAPTDTGLREFIIVRSRGLDLVAFPVRAEPMPPCSPTHRRRSSACGDHSSAAIGIAATATTPAVLRYAMTIGIPARRSSQPHGAAATLWCPTGCLLSTWRHIQRLIRAAAGTASAEVLRARICKHYGVHGW